MGKMNRTVLGLSALLIVQLVVAGGLALNRGQREDVTSLTALNRIATDAYDEIVLSDGENDLRMTKNGDTWVLPEESNVPADGARIASLMRRIEDIAPGFPVARKQSSQDQLKVTAENYQRRITLSGNEGEPAILYLGTSSGLRESHIRLDGEVETYTSRLNSYQVPVKRGDWIDKWQISLENLDRVEGGEFKLVRENDRWRLEDVVYEDSEAIADRIIDVVEAIQDMAVLDLAEVADESILEWQTWTAHVGDKQYVYRIAAGEDKDRFATREDMDFIFRINEGVFDTLASATVEYLLEGDRKPEEEQTQSSQ